MDDMVYWSRVLAATLKHEVPKNSNSHAYTMYLRGVVIKTDASAAR